MPLKQSIFVHQIQMLRGCFQLIIYNWINDTWLPSVMVSSLGSFFSFSPFCDLISYSGKGNQSAEEFNQKWGVSEFKSLAFFLQTECCLNLYLPILETCIFKPILVELHFHVFKLLLLLFYLCHTQRITELWQGLHKCFKSLIWGFTLSNILFHYKIFTLLEWCQIMCIKQFIRSHFSFVSFLLPCWISETDS